MRIPKTLAAWTRALLLALCAVAGQPAFAQPAPAQPSPHAIDIPRWFTESFLDFREDVADAARAGKRLLVYIGQDGCPYCRKLMSVNFSQQIVVDKTRRHFVATALNLWGDRETTWLDGRSRSEKELARFLDVQFTPTLLFFDESGAIVARLDGYYPPQRFEAVLDYVAGRHERRETLATWLARHAKEPASPRLHDQPFLMGAPHDLRRVAGGKPLAVIFETVDCAACDEMHGEGFRRPEVLAQVGRFDVARFMLAAPTPLVTPDGRSTTADAWSRELRIDYTPSIVFFDASGREVFRIAAYLRPFHLAGSFAYVADRGYATEPSFQRWLQARAEHLRARGERVEMWE
ncbi:MAG: thioredoxin fold domain-containing protein [Burkholderiales bacterium]|nr:thioredoxin fold domain-containing protein [Burkholderiales bacterium]